MPRRRRLFYADAMSRAYLSAPMPIFHLRAEPPSAPPKSEPLMRDEPTPFTMPPLTRRAAERRAAESDAEPRHDELTML